MNFNFFKNKNNLFVAPKAVWDRWTQVQSQALNLVSGDTDRT